MPSVDDIFSGNSLKASDITGREPTVVIKSVIPQEFTQRDGKVTRKLVIAFERSQKTFVCNKTNATRIAVLHGKDYAQWVGKKITLFVDPFVEYGGTVTPAIRIKPPVHEPARQESPAPQHYADPDPMPPPGLADDELDGGPPIPF